MEQELRAACCEFLMKSPTRGITTPRSALVAAIVSLSVVSAARAQAPFAVLHEFSGYAYAAGPSAPLVEGSDGYFYGTTLEGGAFHHGQIFRISPSGVLTILHEFAGGATDGEGPQSALIQASDGNFYGTTASGGIYN